MELWINKTKSVEVNLGPSVTQDELDLLFIPSRDIFVLS